jgi:hypothetical protein
MFENEAATLKWYESEERILTKSFLDSIAWSDVAKYQLDSKFIPVLIYMRDVEKFTDIYYQQLLRTPTGQDPIIRKFMDRWMAEESLHADLLNRLLNEAGFVTSDRWFEEAKRQIPTGYFARNRATTAITNLFGENFGAVHMTWGAINELSTLNGYFRLWTLAKHPVLEYILRGIAREEARHSLFYASIARLKLSKSPFRQKLTYFIIDHFWTPVGQGTKRAADTNYVISVLFGGQEGIETFDARVTKQIQDLPGLKDLTVTTKRVASVA